MFCHENTLTRLSYWKSFLSLSQSNPTELEKITETQLTFLWNISTYALQSLYLRKWHTSTTFHCSGATVWCLCVKYRVCGSETSTDWFCKLELVFVKMFIVWFPVTDMVVGTSPEFPVIGMVPVKCPANRKLLLFIWFPVDVILSNNALFVARLTFVTLVEGWRPRLIDTVFAGNVFMPAWVSMLNVAGAEVEITVEGADGTWEGTCCSLSTGSFFTRTNCIDSLPTENTNIYQKFRKKMEHFLDGTNIIFCMSTGIICSNFKLDISLYIWQTVIYLPCISSDCILQMWNISSILDHLLRRSCAYRTYEQTDIVIQYILPQTLFAGLWLFVLLDIVFVNVLLRSYLL